MTWQAVIPGNKPWYMNFTIEAATADAAKVKLEAKMLKNGFYGTCRLWKEAGQRLEQIPATVKAEA